MTGAVRLSATLPKSEAGNGLRGIAKTLLDEPRTIRYAVVAFDVAQMIDDLDSGTDTAVVRLQQFEPLTGDESDRARQLLEEAMLARLGEAGQLDFDEDE